MLSMWPTGTSSKTVCATHTCTERSGIYSRETASKRSIDVRSRCEYSNTRRLASISPDPRTHACCGIDQPWKGRLECTEP